MPDSGDFFVMTDDRLFYPCACAGLKAAGGKGAEKQETISENRKWSSTSWKGNGSLGCPYASHKHQRSSKSRRGKPMISMSAAGVWQLEQEVFIPMTGS